jgi:hypothetical protein
MSKVHTAFAPLATLLLCWAFVGWFDWSRGRMFDFAFIDVPILVVLIIVVIKSLIDSPSESERQRRSSFQLNSQ